MATIYLNDPNINEKCVILEPREALIYPFNFGDWNEIRIGASISFTTSDSNSEIYSEEVVSFSNSAPNGFYWGLKTSGESLPYTSGTYYFGAFSTGNINQSRLRATAGSTRLYAGGTDEYSVGFASGDQFSARQNASFVSISRATGFTGQTLIGEAYRIVNKGISGQGILYAHSSTSNQSGILMSGLRAAAANVTPNLLVQIQTGNSIPPLSELNTLYIYSPFLSNRIRIHSLSIEKYA